MKKKIIVEIAEGLGNQMFMYANAFSLSKKLNYELLIDDTSGYSKKKNIQRSHSKYMLHYFEINEIISPNIYKYDNHIKRVKKKIEIISEKFNYKKKFLIEKNIKINGKKIAQNFELPDAKYLRNILYLQGNFEDQNYFKKYRNDIIQLFKPKKKFLKENQEIINKLKNTNSVSIHIRQHKYSEQKHEKINKIKIEQSKKFTLDLIDYINKSVLYFKKNISDPVFFIWSNDFDGIEDLFKNDKFIFIKNNDSINDFHLFSFAKHFIVGGSSYHWWGAWLNMNPNKICVCPLSLNPSDNPNFYPDEWIKI